MNATYSDDDYFSGPISNLVDRVCRHFPEPGPIMSYRVQGWNVDRWVTLWRGRHYSKATQVLARLQRKDFTRLFRIAMP